MKKNSIIFILLLAIWPSQKIAAQTQGFYAPQNTLESENLSIPQKNFSFSFQTLAFPVDQNIILSWHAPLQVENNSSISPKYNLDTDLSIFFAQPTAPAPDYVLYNYRIDKIYSYLENLAPQFDLETVEPKFTASGTTVTDFNPGQNGQRLELYQSAFNAAEALKRGQKQSELIIVTTAPQKTLADINPFKIKELVAEGLSNFKGSPQNRRHNITVGVEKMKGRLVPPKTTFSFDDNLGPVDGEHGFLPELVIKANGTIPEFGGGLCQVSTTAFRAAMNAGLPIVERRNHAYAVQYYSPQGTDATIYPGVVDLKFINDTPGYLLIWPYEKDGNTLVFDFYGIKDGRQVTLDKPDVYDKQPDGSMKATWTRHITVNGTTKTDIFKSVYQSPALFHHEESFALGPEFYIGTTPKKTQ